MLAIGPARLPGVTVAASPSIWMCRYHFFLGGPPLISKWMWSSLMVTSLMRARSPGLQAGPHIAIQLRQSGPEGVIAPFLSFSPVFPMGKLVRM